jgi:hypothetical protein
MHTKVVTRGFCDELRTCTRISFPTGKMEVTFCSGKRTDCQVWSNLSRQSNSAGQQTMDRALDQVMLDGQHDGLALTMDTQLVQNFLEVIAYRRIADTQCLGDLLGRLTLREQI